MGVMQKGDEIIVPANTYIASVLAISDNGLVPVLVEPDINTYNIDYNKIEETVTSKTKAITVHLYGRVVWITRPASIGREIQSETYWRQCAGYRRSVERN